MALNILYKTALIMWRLRSKSDFSSMHLVFLWRGRRAKQHKGFNNMVTRSKATSTATMDWVQCQNLVQPHRGEEGAQLHHLEENAAVAAQKPKVQIIM